MLRTLCFALALCGFTPASLATETGDTARTEDASTSEWIALLATAQEGDVIFIGDDGGWAFLGAAVSKTDKRYGHVGVVMVGADGLDVIDAGGHPFAPEATVERQPIADFLKPAERLGLYRPTLKPADLKTYLAALTAADGTLFDHKFSLETEDRVYCTEYVWRALSAALGTDSVPSKTEWNGKLVISLEDLQTSPHLTPVGHAVRAD